MCEYFNVQRSLNGDKTPWEKLEPGVYTCLISNNPYILIKVSSNCCKMVYCKDIHAGVPQGIRIVELINNGLINSLRRMTNA